MNFEAIIGLEIHVEMKTKSKMFSSSPVSFSRNPNTNIAYLDMAFPGSMPVVNKQAVINALRVANALNMEIDPLVRFDRKNYFYSDLPKGFQITQQFHPIGKNGYVIVDTPNGKKRIGIERIHMEEDTCKQEHFLDYTLLDYNRAGVPLVEIVSLPEISSGLEAREYAEAIRNIVLYSGTSDGKMEEGSLRCDTNISIRPYGQKEFGTKVEIKNINSFKNIELAIDYEIKRQSTLLLKGEKVRQETRRFDESSGKTILMRVKADAVDYKYFPEPNITPIRLSDKFVKDVIESCPELYDSKYERYIASGLSKTDAEIILASPENALFFEEGSKYVENAKDFANFMIVELNTYINKTGKKLSELSMSPKTLSEIVLMQEKGGLTHKQCTQILDVVLEKGISPEKAKKELNIVSQASDNDTVKAFVDEILANNPQSIADFKAGKDRALGFLVGQVMKASKGKVNPAAVSKMLLEEIKKR